MNSHPTVKSNKELDVSPENEIPNNNEYKLPLLNKNMEPDVDESQLTQTTLLNEENNVYSPCTTDLEHIYLPHRKPSTTSIRSMEHMYLPHRKPSNTSSYWFGSGILKNTSDKEHSISNFHVEFMPVLPEEPIKIPTVLWPQVMATIAVSLASMVIGIASAYTAPAIPSMNEANSTLWIELDGEEASWIGSLMPLGALFGGIIGSAPVEKLGRKRTIMATAIPFILSWLLIALASNIWMIYAARTIAGICIGLIGLTLPVYLAETVQPEVRGTLGLLPTTIGNTGIIVSFIAGKYMDWRNLAYLGAVLSVPYLICMKLIPESPRWYISNDREAEAEKSLQWFRGKDTDIKTEFNQIRTANMIAKKNDTKFKDLFTKAYMKLALISLGLMFFQQFSGINAVIFYSTAIFKKTGSSIDEYLSTIIVGLVNLGAIFIAILLIDRLGRKVLLLISDTFMIISLGVLGSFFYAEKYHEDMIEGMGWIPLAGLMAYVVAFSLGFGPVPWLMMGEIFPTRIRGPAAALTTAFNWTCTFLVTKTFPQVVQSFGLHTAFFGFAIICIVGIFFIIFEVPETRGQSLEDIERNLTRPFRRVSSLSNLKPFPMST